MEEKENVAPAGAVQGAEAPVADGTAAACGKFKSADALLRAYNSLEAEFTRRSQRLRELEGRLAREEAARENAPAASPSAGGEEGGAETPAPAAGGAAPAGEAAPFVLGGGGAFALAPARRIRSFEEAGALARELFGRSGK